MYVRLQGMPGLPYFFTHTYPNGTFQGFPTINDVNDYVMEVVGVDDSLVETSTTFTLSVKPCYYKCSYCWDPDYDTCLKCKDGYFLSGSECSEQCPPSTFVDSNGVC